MKTLLSLLNICWREKFWVNYDVFDEEAIETIKTRFIGRIEEFLQWLIDNKHIEEIKSEKKSWPDVNDYIKYIADTEDPIKTLTDMLK